MADPHLRDDARGRVSVDHAEREMRTAVTAAFRQYLTHVEQAILDRRTSGNLTAAGEPDLDLWPPAHIWNRLVREHILPTARRILARVFNRFLTKHQRARLDENDYIQQVLDDTRERMTGATWPDEVYDAVRDVIRAGHEAGDNRRTLRRKLRQALGPDQWTGRADTIARTEATAALSQGTWQAGKARQDVFGETLFKRWSAIDDARTRPAHAHADGQVVPYAEPFTVGGEALQFPHDPTGSPGQTINCRCVLLVEDAEESRERSDALSADGTVTAVKGKMPGVLKRYWTHGKGAAKIRWGTKNDFYRCRRHLQKYVPPHMIDGLCSNLHKRALGVRPGQEGAKKADAGGCAPCDDMTDEQIEEALSAMRDDPALSGELNPDENPEPTEDGEREEPVDAEPEQPATSDDGITDQGKFDIPAEDEVDDADLDDGDGNTVTSAADFTKSGSPNAAKRKRAEKNRHAMKGGRFPIENSNDLRKAIHAIGRSGGGPRGRAAVKAHIIRRAKTLGLESRLPEAWRSGSKKTTATAATSANSWYETVSERVPNHPPADWFTNPELSGPTKVRITDQGRVYGHLAAWDTEHASLPGVTARMFADDPLARFHRHPIRTTEGERVRTGPLATGGHASTDENVGLTAAQSHYDDPTFVAADVTVGKDEHGLWCSGSLRPGASPFQVMLLDRYSISGDWRNGELVAACSVSVPGFHLDDDQNVYALAADAGPNRPTLGDHRPRANVDADGYLSSLVAAGVVTEQQPATSPLDGWQLFRQFRQAQREHEQAEAAQQRVRAAAYAPLADRVRSATRQG